MSAQQRIRQGIRALLAFRYEVDYDLATRYLTPRQLTIFRSLSRSEQLHSLNVLRDVLAQSDHTPNDLAVAALLHDAGKSRYALRTWQKTLAVIVRKVSPALEQNLSQSETLTFWRAPYVVRRWHPKWSGELLRSIDASEQSIWLVEHHADPIEQWLDHPAVHLLKRLKEADDKN